MHEFFNFALNILYAGCGMVVFVILAFFFAASRPQGSLLRIAAAGLVARLIATLAFSMIAVPALFLPPFGELFDVFGFVFLILYWARFLWMLGSAAVHGVEQGIRHVAKPAVPLLTHEEDR
jgi:hypothetical protein